MRQLAVGLEESGKFDCTWLRIRLMRLRKHGQKETKASIAAKLGRGTFSAVFFITSLAALGLENIPLGDV